MPYRASWPHEFKHYGLILRCELGDLALRIDHIGSTSVPFLAAKDIIDIQVTVSDFSPQVELAICRAGYERLATITHDHLPPGAPDREEEWKKWFFKSLPPERRINLHVRLAGHANQRYPLLFRDYLRANLLAAQTYAQIKNKLAQHFASDIDAYYDVKDPVCDLIIGAAEIWAKEYAWKQGPSDC